MRLIDADALLDTIAIIAKKFAKTDAQKALMGRVMYIIEHRPECIVRCKDCKYAYINSFSAASGVALCKKLSNEAETAIRQQDDYCSYGERKEE